jgi:DMSO/TMAO reductase YedYZ molybdopterin-dependent catalytic subunit
MIVDRRRLLGAIGIGGGSLLLAGCDRLNRSPAFQSLLDQGEKLTMRGQRLVTSRNALAPEFTGADLSPVFRSNGTRMPASPAYAAHAANRFIDWRVVVDGLVQRPQSFSLAQIGKMPIRTQITRHDCVEGWCSTAPTIMARCVIMRASI